MRALLVLAALLMPAAVSAQVTNPVPPPNMATTTDLAAAQANADAALAAAQAACMPMATVPPPEVIGGSAGTGKACRLATAVQPRITRTVAFTTGTDGTIAVTWPAMPSVPLVFPIANVSSTDLQVPACFPVTGTITTTGATVKCFKTQTLLGLGLVPFAAATTAVTGQVLAIPPS